MELLKLILKVKTKWGRAFLMAFIFSSSMAQGQEDGTTISFPGSSQLESAAIDTTENDIYSDFNSEFTEQKAQEQLRNISPNKKMAMIWRSRIVGESADLSTQTSETAGVDIRLRSRYYLLENLHADVYLRGKFESGHSQDFFGDLEPASGVFVREGVITLTEDLFYEDDLEVKLGVIDQDWMDESLLIFRKSFPGVKIRYQPRWFRDVDLSFTSQVAIPTSVTLSTRTVEQEETPQFVVQNAFAQWNVSRDTQLSFSGILYQYRNLPSFVAFESQKYGNNAAGFNGPLNSRFSFGFDGWLTTFKANHRLNNTFRPYAQWTTMKNEDAPETFNDSQLIGIGTQINLPRHLIYFEVVNFFTESDVVPAYYNSWAAGHTNREGWGFDTAIEFKKSNFRIRSYYYQADVINENSPQQNQGFFFIGVETAYDKIL